ncbi:MAG: HAD-IIIC family phosphatase [Suilimivivens sp.]
MKKSKKIKRELLDTDKKFLNKKIAVLGGSTTHDIIRILELFLLDQGIRPEFYESEYAQYWQDAMFDNPELQSFAPDLIFIHTSNRNITAYPQAADSRELVEEKLNDQYNHFEVMWDKLLNTYHCPVIQNNFEFPFYRLMGNKEASDIHGRIRFLTRLNEKFYRYSENHENFYINDINYLSAMYGLDKWADPFFWHMYKYSMCMQAIPEFAYNLSHIIKAVFGKNKKAFVLDLDNTLWGGIVGDDGPENLEIGQETSLGQVYAEFQDYIKAHKDIGIMLNVDSKNDEVNAIAGLNHPAGVLKPEDFIIIKANWEPKSKNLAEIASELNIGRDALVFVDDNPREREIIRQQIPEAAVPEITEGEETAPEKYIRILDRNGYFEVISLSEDDRNRSDMYKANVLRKKQEESFGDYTEYLRSLEMKAEIKSFSPVYMARIAQLTNKSNQFNLTTRRYTQAEIEQIAKSDEYIAMYGKLADKFGDNGVVSVVIGHKQDKQLHMDLWIMSCRVLKRDMEFAMMDALAAECQKAGIDTIIGYYYPTAKNSMVRNFYELQGFSKIKEDGQGNTIWQFDVQENYEKKNKVIAVNEQQ